MSEARDHPVAEEPVIGAGGVPHPDVTKAKVLLRGGIKQVLDGVQAVVDAGQASELSAPLRKLARRLAEADAEYVEDLTGSYETYGDIIGEMDDDEDLGDMPIDWDEAERAAADEVAKEEAAKAAAEAAKTAAAEPESEEVYDEDAPAKESEEERKEREAFDKLFSERAFED